MNRKVVIRVWMLAWGIGSFVAGMAIAVLSLIFSSPGWLPGGIVLVGLGIVLTVVGVIGFAIYGSVRKRS